MYCAKLLVSFFTIHCILSQPIADFTEDSALEYLEQFGNSVDDSDGDIQTQGGPRVSLRQYLKNFQSFFGLPVTGTLDPETEELMTKPRCGVPDDIKNLHVRTTRSNTARKWNRNRLTYRVVRYGGKITTVSVDRIVEKALKLWEGAADIKFAHQASGQADIEISFATWEHGRELLGDQWASCDPEFDGPGATKSVLAHAFLPKPNRRPNSKCPERIDGDVHVDDDEDWSEIYGEGLDLLHTMTHELGHSLGLSHSRGFPESKDSPIMQAYHPGWIDPTKFKLHEDDERRIHQLYGPPKPKTSDFESTVRPPITPPAPVLSKCVCDSFTRFDPKRKRNVGNCQTKYKGKTWCYVQKTADCPDSKTSNTVEDYNWSVEACRNEDFTSTTKLPVIPVPTPPPVIPVPTPPPAIPVPRPPSTPAPGPASNPKPSPGPGNDDCVCDDFTRYDERRRRDVGNCLTEYRGETWCYILKTTNCPDSKTSKSVNSHNWSRVACHQQRSTKDLTKITGKCVCDPFTRFDETLQQVAGNCQTLYQGDAWCYVQKTADCGDSQASSTVDGYNWSREACSF